MLSFLFLKEYVMSSGEIDEQERAELAAAEKGFVLPRPPDYQRYWLTPEYFAQLPTAMQEVATKPWWQNMMARRDEEHERIHQATIEYLKRKALGERVTQPQ